MLCCSLVKAEIGVHAVSCGKKKGELCHIAGGTRWCPGFFIGLSLAKPLSQSEDEDARAYASCPFFAFHPHNFVVPGSLSAILLRSLNEHCSCAGYSSWWISHRSSCRISWLLVHESKLSDGEQAYCLISGRSSVTLLRAASCEML